MALPTQLADQANPDAPEPKGLMGAIRKIFGSEEPEEEVAAAPKDPYQDKERLEKLMEEFHPECFNGREEFERIWWRNIIYSEFGRHWIYYDRDSRTWRDKRLAKWIPKPVTNITGETVDTIVATFQAVQLGVTVRPVGNAPENVTAAEIADRYAPSLDEAHAMKARMRIADRWGAVTGGCFLHVWWDPNDERSMRMIPFERCSHCQEVVRPDELTEAEGICPKCESSTLFEPAMDPETGEPLGERVTDGGGRTDVCSLLEMGFPLSLENEDELPGLLRLRWKPKSWFQRFRPELLDEIEWEKMTPERSLQMLRGLATQTGMTTQPFSGVGSQPSETEGITEAELWWKPSKEYPEGLVCRYINNGGWQVLEYPDENLPGPIPHEDASGNKLWPWVYYPYKTVAGRFIPESPINVIIQKNDQLNQIDALIQLCMQRTANPVWLEPKGAEVEKFTGEPGLVVKYNPLIAGGASKPERIEGASVPAYILEYRRQIVEDIERLAGTYDILKGQKPAGVEAFAAMQLLVERSQSRFGPVLEQRGEAYRRWFALALELERQYGPESRTVAVMGPNDSWAFETFQNADLQGAVQILVEDGSQVPKTNLGERAAIEHLNQLGLLDVQNPDTKYEVLKSFGQTKLMPQLDVQVRSCRAMQDEFEKWAATAELIPPDPLGPPFEPDPMNPGMPMLDPATAEIDPATQQPIPGTGQPMPAQPQWSEPPPGEMRRWHDPIIYAAEIRKWLCGDRMRSLLKQKPDLVPVAEQLLAQYEDVLAMQAMAAAAVPGEPGGPPDQEPGGAGRAMRNSNQNAGAVPAAAA